MLGKKRQFYNNSLARSTFKTRKTSKWSTAPRGQMGGNVPYSIQQVTNFGYITATNADVHNAYTFKLNDLPNHADLEATFDQYRFKKVVIHFIPLNNVLDIKDATPASQSAGMLGTAKDYNDANAPATANEVFSYQNCKFSPTYERHVRSLKPKLLIQEDGGFGGFGFNPTNPWVPTAYNAVEWCGVKYSILHSPDNTRVKYQVMCVYHIEFQNVK